MPEKYQVKYGAQFYEKKDVPAQKLWGFLTEFLSSQVRMIEQYTPWMFDEEPAAEEHSYKYDERANALNIHCEKRNVDLNAEMQLENEKQFNRREKDRNKALTKEIEKLKKNQSKFQKRIKKTKICRKL